MGTDVTATNGTSVVFASGTTVNDIVDIVAYGTFVLADHLTQTQSDARYVEVAGDTMTGNLDVTGTVTADGLTVQATSGSSTGVIRSASGSNSTLYLDTQDTTSLSYITVSGSLGIATGSGTPERMRISNNGDISFYEDTGTTAKFFWDASAESLGIGTTTPSAYGAGYTTVGVNGSTMSGVEG
ncbi:MAG: hypothetical protein ACPHUD_11075, partial [Porticoccaceae bacterium]